MPFFHVFLFIKNFHFTIRWQMHIYEQGILSSINLANVEHAFRFFVQPSIQLLHPDFWYRHKIIRTKVTFRIDFHGFYCGSSDTKIKRFKKTAKSKKSYKKFTWLIYYNFFSMVTIDFYRFPCFIICFRALVKKIIEEIAMANDLSD